MKILRFLVFLFITGSKLLAQQPILLKFSVQRAGSDGQILSLEGMKNEAGQIIIPADYDYIWDFDNDSLTLARKLNFSSIDGTVSITYQIISNAGFLNYEFPHYLVPESIQENLIRTLNERTGKYGFVDCQGEVKIKFRYTGARDFKENLACVLDESSKKWGYINHKGQFEIQPQFDEAFSFSEGQAVVKLANDFSFINKNGNIIKIEGAYHQVFDLKEGYSVITSINKDTVLYGFINKTGNTILSPRYKFLDNFESGTAVFVDHNEAGMINTKGEVVIEPRYDELYRFDQAHYLFQINGLKGLIDIDGKLVLPAAYSSIDWFSDGLCAVYKSGKWGFADIEGNEAIPCQFIEIKSGFKNGQADVKLPDRFYLIHGDDTLNLPEYDEVLPYYSYCAAFRKGNLWGFLNQKGEESIEPKFDELVFNKGAVVFGKTSKEDGTFLWSVIDPYGREVQFEKYNEVVRFADGLAAVKNKNGWGFVNKSGVEIVSPHFDAVRNFSSGRAAVNYNGNWGFINDKGREEIPFYQKTPIFEETIPTTNADTIKAIRESFPLYKMQVLGDFNGTCACIEDELTESNPMPLCLNKIGKIYSTENCIPYTRKADLFEPELEINPLLNLIRIPGQWLTIDKTGKVIPQSSSKN